MIRPFLRLAALALAATALSGCISLLPQSKPATLYRFGPDASSPPHATPPSSLAVLRTNGKFQEEAADDRILTMTRGQAAYIARSRWVAPAEVLFDEAVANAFDASPIRLIARGQRGRASYSIRIDVRSFETDYASGSNTPQVVVRAHVALTRSDESSVGEQDFEARVPAGDNRVNAIVGAYDKAVSDVTGKIVAWTEAHAT
jgi:cholesterol transport system auxiliary component